MKKHKYLVLTGVRVLSEDSVKFCGTKYVGRPPVSSRAKRTVDLDKQLRILLKGNSPPYPLSDKILSDLRKERG